MTRTILRAWDYARLQRLAHEMREVSDMYMAPEHKAQLAGAAELVQALAEHNAQANAAHRALVAKINTYRGQKRRAKNMAIKKELRRAALAERLAARKAGVS
jgi:hypothetical protein